MIAAPRWPLPGNVESTCGDAGFASDTTCDAAEKPGTTTSSPKMAMPAPRMPPGARFTCSMPTMVSGTLAAGMGAQSSGTPSPSAG
jgi:hypothetical protein